MNPAVSMARLSLILALSASAVFIFTGHAEAADLNRPVPIKPEHTRSPEAKLWDHNLVERFRFAAITSSVKTGGYLAAGDVDGDGKDELIVGSGQGNLPEVRIYSADGSLRSTFLAYVPQFRGGVRVASADTDGDGKAEIITAPGPGAPSKIYVFNPDGSRKVAGEFMAYSPQFTGGVRVAAGDLNGDGKAEIVTAPGPGGGPHVRILGGNLQDLGFDFFPFDAQMTDGVNVSILRTPDGPSIAASVESWEMPLVKTFVFKPGPVLATEFLAFGIEQKHGAVTAAFDLDRDGFDEIAAAPNGGAEPVVRFFDRYGTFIRSAMILDKNYRGGLSLAQVRSPQNAPLLATLPAYPVFLGHADHEKFIEVDISEQRLYAYEHGRIARTFLVSTGTYKYPTPLGKTTVKKKIPIMDYRWSYGRNHPDNYYLKNVRYNLNVFPHIYIHSAYWHKNFGHRMSHGCINTQLADAQWIYNWAGVGTDVVTQE